jgi:hypothetical protein
MPEGDVTRVRDALRAAWQRIEAGRYEEAGRHLRAALALVDLVTPLRGGGR